MILTFWDWHGVFWVLVGYGVIMMSCLRLLPETSAATERVAVQLREAPRAYLAILRDTPFMLYVVVAASASAMLMSYITSSSFLYIEMLAVTPRQFGIFFGINALGLISASQLNRVALRDFRLDQIAQRAFIGTVSVATMMLIVVVSGWVNLVTVSVLFFLLCMSVGFIMPNIAALAFGHIHGRMGSASALQGTIQSIVGGIAGTMNGVLSNGTMWPIVGVIGSAAVCGALVLVITQRRVGAVPSA